MSAEYKSVFLTGASSGIGEELSKWFAARHLKVFAAARRLDRLEALAASTPNIVPVQLDVTDLEATRAVMHRIDDEVGGLDLVIANAGVGGTTSVRRPMWEETESLLRVNVNGAANTLLALLPRMVQRKRGHIAGVASLAGVRGFPGFAGYCGSKSFLAKFMESLRLDLRGSGVLATTIDPGWVKSEMTAKNAFRMPFLMETQDAANLVGQALLEGQGRILFPWQVALGARVLAVLPASLYERASPGQKRFTS